MYVIAAVDRKWGIGRENELLVSIPNDMKFFREKTNGSTIIMGRKTLESFPGGRPLPNRLNIVMTTDRTYQVKGAVVVHDFEELREYLAKGVPGDVFCIGGESMYRQMLPLCDTAYITKIDHTYEADKFFPNLDEDPSWEEIEVSDEMTYFDLIYHFVVYRRK